MLQKKVYQIPDKRKKKKKKKKKRKKKGALPGFEPRFSGLQPRAHYFQTTWKVSNPDSLAYNPGLTTFRLHGRC